MPNLSYGYNQDMGLYSDLSKCCYYKFCYIDKWLLVYKKNGNAEKKPNKKHEAATILVHGIAQFIAHSREYSCLGYVSCVCVARVPPKCYFCFHFSSCKTKHPTRSRKHGRNKHNMGLYNTYSPWHTPRHVALHI